MKVNKSLTKVEFTRKEYRGILGNLRKIYKLLEKPENWVQGEYKTETSILYDPERKDFKELDKPIIQMCLMGANNVADGLHEANTDVFMAFNLPQTFKNNFLSTLKYTIHEYDNIEYGTIASLVYEFADGEQQGGFVEEFNDHHKTTHTTILTWLRKLIKKAEKLAV